MGAYSPQLCGEVLTSPSVLIYVLPHDSKREVIFLRLESKTTRPKLIRALEMLDTKRDQNPPKKHDDTPL